MWVEYRVSACDLLSREVYGGHLLLHVMRTYVHNHFTFIFHDIDHTVSRDAQQQVHLLLVMKARH